MTSSDDVLRKAGSLFSRVGSGLRGASKQVTGIGRGTVRLTLERMRFAPGDAIDGILTLALPEPVEARALQVVLRATQRTASAPPIVVRPPSRQHPSQHPGPSITEQEVYRFEHELAPEGTFSSGQHRFQLVLPADAFDRTPPQAGGGTVGDVVRGLASVFGPTVGPIKWQLQGSLIIAWGKNLTHRLDLMVG